MEQEHLARERRAAAAGNRHPLEATAAFRKVSLTGNTPKCLSSLQTPWYFRSPRMHWFDLLIRCMDAVPWFDSLIRFIDSIHCFDSLIRKKRKHTIKLCIAIGQQEALLMKILLVVLKTAQKVRKLLRFSSHSINKRTLMRILVVVVFRKPQTGKKASMCFIEIDEQEALFMRILNVCLRKTHRSARGTFDENPCRCLRKTENSRKTTMTCFIEINQQEALLMRILVVVCFRKTPKVEYKKCVLFQQKISLRINDYTKHNFSENP